MPRSTEYSRIHRSSSAAKFEDYRTKMARNHSEVRGSLSDVFEKERTKAGSHFAAPCGSRSVWSYRISKYGSPQRFVSVARIPTAHCAPSGSGSRRVDHA